MLIHCPAIVAQVTPQSNGMKASSAQKMEADALRSSSRDFHGSRSPFLLWFPATRSPAAMPICSRNNKCFRRWLNSDRAAIISRPQFTASPATFSRPSETRDTHLVFVSGKFWGCDTGLFSGFTTASSQSLRDTEVEKMVFLGVSVPLWCGCSY